MFFLVILDMFYVYLLLDTLCKHLLYQYFLVHILKFLLYFSLLVLHKVSIIFLLYFYMT